MTGRDILKHFSEPLVIEGGRGDAVIIKVGSALIGFNRRMCPRSILFVVTTG
jgi:hypothetical protein